MSYEYDVQVVSKLCPSYNKKPAISLHKSRLDNH